MGVALKYEVHHQAEDSHLGLGNFEFEEIPVLGAIPVEDTSSVIFCIQEKERRIIISDRIMLATEKPFIELDWHLAVAYCRRCQDYHQIVLAQKSAFCPRCGIMENGQKCMDTDAAILLFNDYVHKHICSYEECEQLDTV